MAQLVNTILVSVVAFFAFLAVFGYFGGAPHADPAPAPAAARITAVSAQWGPEQAARDLPAEDGSAPQGEATADVPFVVQLRLSNPSGRPAHVVAATLRATSGDISFGETTQAVDVAVPAQGNVTVVLHGSIPSAAMPLWWKAYASGAERSGLRLDGHVDVKETGVAGSGDGDASGSRQLPFVWTSQWTGDLARTLHGDAATFPCAAEDAACLDGLDASWTKTPAALQLHVRIVGPDGSAGDVQGGTAVLFLGPQAVARGELVAVAGTPGAVLVSLAPDAAALSSWLPAHAAACEHSALELRITADLGDGAGGTVQASWSATGTFETHWLCGVRA